MKLVIGKGSCGIAAGADKVSDSAEKYIAEKNLNIPVSVTGCIGMCYLEPIVDIIKDNGEKTTYVKVTADAIKEIIDSELAGNICEKYLIPKEDKERLESQTRIALRNCGIINPESIDEYIEKNNIEKGRDYENTKGTKIEQRLFYLNQILDLYDNVKENYLDLNEKQISKQLDFSPSTIRRYIKEKELLTNLRDNDIEK